MDRLVGSRRRKCRTSNIGPDAHADDDISAPSIRKELLIVSSKKKKRRGRKSKAAENDEDESGTDDETEQTKKRSRTDSEQIDDDGFKKHSDDEETWSDVGKIFFPLLVLVGTCPSPNSHPHDFFSSAPRRWQVLHLPFLSCLLFVG